MQPCSQRIDRRSAQRISQSIDDGNFLTVKVKRQILRPLLDSGSQLSLVSANLIKRLNLQINPLEMGTPRNLFAANGSRLDVIGSLELPIVIKGLTFPQDVLVISNLNESFILGVDFMRSYNVILDYRNCEIIIEDLLRLPIHNEHRKENFVRVTKPICIKPYSVAHVSVSVARRFINKDCLIEAIHGEQFEKFAVQRIVSHPVSSSTVCRVLNFKPEPLVIRKGERIAAVSSVDVNTCESYNEFEDSKTNPSQRNPTKSEIDKFVTESGIQVSDKLTEIERKRVATLVHEFRDIFVKDVANIKRLKVPPHEISLKDNRTSNTRQYRLSPNDQVEADRQITELVKNGLVEEATLRGAMSFNTPLILVPKRDGTKRLVCDFRKANSLVLPLQVALPRIDDQVAQIASSNSMYMSCMDLKSGYWQVPVAESSRDLLTFTNPLTGSRYRWTVCPFGFVNSGSSFVLSLQCVMASLRTRDVLTFVDDVTVFSQSLDSHLERLREVFTLFRKFNVSVNPSKCTIAHDSIEFCGHRISRHGVEMLTKGRTKILESYPSPTTRRGVVKFLAFSNWYRKSIKNYSMRVAKCREIARRPEREFQWTVEAEAELRDIIATLLSMPILAPVDPKRDFVIFVDSSDSAVGWTIGQMDDQNIFRVNYYGGHQLARSNLAWPICHKEIFAAVSCIRSHEVMLIGKHLTVVTDNASLQNLRTMQNASGRLQRWTSYLGNFDISYKSIPGHRNVAADTLSRLFEDSTDEAKMEFVPSALTDCSDYILSVSTTNDSAVTETSFLSYDFIVEGDLIDINGTASNADASTDKAAITVSSLHPHAELFTGTTGIECETADEFYDCCDDSFLCNDGINVVTRQQARLTEKTSKTSNTTCDSTAGIQASNVQDITPVDSSTNVEDTGDQDNSVVTDSNKDELNLKIVPKDYMCDSEFSHMYIFLSTGQLPENETVARAIQLTYDLFTIDETDHLLYRITQPRSKRERTVKPLQRCLCLPLRFQYYVVNFLHNFLSHPSTERLYLTAKERYFFKNLYNLSESLSRSCTLCQECKRDHAHVTAPLHPLPVQGFMQQWHFDHCNLARKSKQGHQYLLIFIESYSGWPEIYPVFTTGSLETAKCLVDLVSRWGIMSKVYSDRGAGYVAKTFQAVAKLLGVTHKLTAALAPQSDGKAERGVAQVKANLRLMCDTDEEIVEKLPMILIGMRACVSTVTKVSPFHAIFGSPMALPVPGCDKETPSQPYERMRVAEKEYLDRLREQLKELEGKVKLNLTDDKADVKRAYDTRNRVQPVEFHLGDLVWLKNRNVQAGSPRVITHRKFIGPYFVTAIPPCRENEGKAYFLTHSVSGKKLRNPVPVDRLKLCTTDRTELQVKYPGLKTTDSQPVQGSSQPQVKLDSPANMRQSTPDNVTTVDRKTTPHDTQTSQPAYLPARNISRQRFAPGGIEYLVHFENGTIEWVDQCQVSPALKADFLIKRHNQSRARLRK